MRFPLPISPEPWALWFRLLRAPAAWAIGAGLVCALVWLVQSTTWGAGAAGRVAGYHLGDPWTKALVRLPASVLGRTPGLPAWAAVAQVVGAVLIGVAVLCFRDSQASALLVGLGVFLAAVAALAAGLDGFEHATALIIGCAAGVAITFLRGMPDSALAHPY